MSDYRDFIYCQKCEKIMGFGFLRYCHDLEIICPECYRIERRLEVSEI